MSNPSLVFALVEDQRQRQLLYRFLLGKGVRPHQITIEASPTGQGSAERWVRENFARQVGKCRAGFARAATAMFVVLDADKLSVQEHWQELDAALEDDHQRKLDSTTDPIARLIPKWSIETWILYLSSRGNPNPPICEDKPCKGSRKAEQWNEMTPHAAEFLVELTGTAAQLPENMPDSLRSGVHEIPRALPMGQ